MTDNDYDLRAATAGGADGAGVPNGELLVRFAEAVLGTDPVALAQVRQELRDTLGEAVLSDVAATVASFDAVVKLADGSGIPLEEYKEEATRDFRADLGIDALQT